MSEIVALAEVRLWDQRVGAVAEDADGVITFEYSPTFQSSGLDVSPIVLPLSTTGPRQFPELRRMEAFLGLPGLLADALPDRFGNAVIRRYFEERGTPDRALSPVQKLLYLGDRAMGALTFHPALDRSTPEQATPLRLSALVQEARAIVSGNADVAVPDIIHVGSSAGGMRPKALVWWNPPTGQGRSGHAEPTEGDEPWIVKLDGVGAVNDDGQTPARVRASLPYMRIEQAYTLMARYAGLDAVETRLLADRSYRHLLIRRFDRVGDGGGSRVHQHTLGGLCHVDYNEPGTCSYEEFLRTVLRLRLDRRALDEAFRRAAFNILAINQDDHVKNLSFLMGSDGQWYLSPAYDNTYAQGDGWTRFHQMTLAGKCTAITRQDLLDVAKKFSIDGISILIRIEAAVSQWSQFADEAEVPAKATQLIRTALEKRRLGLEAR